MNRKTILIATKFSPPRIGTQTVLRQPLLARLRRSAHCALTLVTGSPGFGKTTLLAQWRQELLKTGTEVSWLSLSPDDRRPQTFCAYLFAALERAGAVIEDDLLLLLEEGEEDQQQYAVNAVLAALVNAVAELPRELFLVLDDFHHVEHELILRLLQGLLNHGPANLHLVIASRAQPALFLSQLRASGQLMEVACAELPFTVDETQAFLQRNLGATTLETKEIAQLHELTGGWPASLQLIAIVLKNHPRSSATLRELLARSGDLTGYLADEVLSHLSPELVNFMEGVSVCRRFNAALAQHLTGCADAAGLIAAIEHQNLFMARVESDDGQPWYRFHPLFGEFLSRRLAQRDGHASALHRRASLWFASQGLLLDALRHASLGGHIELAVELLEQAQAATWSLAYLSPLVHFLDHLPPESLLQRPKLFMLGCMTFALTARPAKAEAWLRAFHAGDNGGRNRVIEAQLPIINALLALQNDDTAQVIRELEPLGDMAWRNPTLRNLHAAALLPAYTAAGRYADVRAFIERNPVPEGEREQEMALMAASVPALALMVEGRVQEAQAAGELVLARAEAAYGRRSVCSCPAATMLATAYYELDRLEQAREVLANRMSMLQFSAPEIMLRAVLCAARLDRLQDGSPAALGMLERHELRFRELGLERAVAYMLAEQSRIHLANGQRMRAAELVSKLAALAGRHAGSEGFMAEIPAVAALSRARVSLVACTPDDALRELAVLRLFAERHGRQQWLVLADLLTAQALFDLKRSDEASSVLSGAVRLGWRLGLVRTFVDEGDILRQHLVILETAGNLEGPVLLYLRGLIERFPGSAPATASARPAIDADRGDRHPAQVTPREREILQLVALAMSNKRIALTLGISLETVKWNLRNIFEKLDVSNRYDAVMWARKLNLIPAA
ncbi:MAG: LuxR C-terminal-related transcriptional regulator [Pseudomonadota bacterium]